MVKNLIKDQQFGGERPLFAIHDTRLENVTITEGESGIKCCSHIEVDHCRFIGKYPLWHVDDSLITDCYFEVGSRSAIWYSNDMKMRDSVIDAPKFFREMRNLELENVTINDADETFWRIQGLKIRNVRLHEGTYPFMFCKDVYVDGLESDSKYVFQYCENIEVHHAKITTKDSFWECKNVVIYDSVIDGEYLGWHSQNLRLVRCHIAGEQPLCYVKGLVLEDCTFDAACDRMFEDSEVQASIIGRVTNIKNPRSGHIIADAIGSITIDENILPPADCLIETRGSGSASITSSSSITSTTSSTSPSIFDEIIPRRNTNSVKWDEAKEDDIIPLWVADMDFPVLTKITEALHQRVNHRVFGYTHVPDSYYETVIRWFRERHGLQGVEPSNIIYTTGVVPAISAIIRALTQPGDKVLVMTPVYNCFFSSIRNQGCEVVESHLVYADRTYTVDWADFEQKCADNQVRVFLLCNPHNPAGRVWTKEELQRMGEICRHHDVFVIADEIHCELVMPGYEYTPFASLCDSFLWNSVTCVAPTKAFNIAGLQIANIIAKDPQIRERVDRAINIHEVCDVNPFGVVATEAAYTDEGAEWLQQLNAYIFANYQFLCDFFRENLPSLPVVKLEGTYLVWVDCSALGRSSVEIVEDLYQHHGVWLNDGVMYGENKGSFVRINIACPRKTLEEGLHRIARALRS